MLNRLKTISTLFFVSLFWFTMANAEDCASDPKACSIIELCKEATITKRGYLEWNFDALSHVALAKDAGLSCGVDQEAKSAEKPSVVKKARFTKNDFLSFSQLERRQIQYALKQLGFYTSSVDGLWGRGTDKAVNDFVLDQNITANVAKTVYQSLSLAVDMSVVTAPRAMKESPTNTTTISSPNNSKNVKICKLNDNPIFEGMFMAEDFVPRTLKQFNSLREILITADGWVFGDKKVKKNSSGKYRRYVDVLCVNNNNNWSKCGSLTGFAEYGPPQNGALKGKLVINWMWSNWHPVQHLEYTCSGS